MVLPKYALSFRFCAIASQNIVDLGRYGCKSYTLVVLGYSEVTIFREDASLCPSVNCVFVIYGITVSEQYVVEFPSLPYFWWYFIKPCYIYIYKERERERERGGGDTEIETISEKESELDINYIDKKDHVDLKISLRKLYIYIYIYIYIYTACR